MKDIFSHHNRFFMLSKHAHNPRRKYRSRQPDAEEPRSSVPVAQQPEIEGPELRQPQNVMALQRTLGNQATLKLLQQNQPAVQRDWTKGVVDENQQRSTTVTLGNNFGQTAPNKPKFRSNKSDKLNNQDKQFGLYKGYKVGKKIKGATQSIIENSDQTLPTVQSPEAYGEQFSNAANVLSSAASGGSVFALQTALSGFMGLIMPYVKLIKLAVKIPLSIRKTHKTRKNLEALKAAYQGSKAKAESGDPVAQTVYDSSKYGYKKVRRQFAERIAKIVIAIVKFATIITDLVTGGTAILFTSISKLLTGVSTGIMTGVAAAKSLYKSMKGTKGVNRRANAEALIEAANKGNPEALHLLYKLKVGKSLYLRQQGITKSKNPFKKEPEFFKGNERGYYQWLMGLTGKEWGRLRGELARKLRSTTAKTFTEKRRAMGV
jgi:hypothetical protein